MFVPNTLSANFQQCFETLCVCWEGIRLCVSWEGIRLCVSWEGIRLCVSWEGIRLSIGAFRTSPVESNYVEASKLKKIASFKSYWVCLNNEFVAKNVISDNGLLLA